MYRDGSGGQNLAGASLTSPTVCPGSLKSIKAAMKLDQPLFFNPIIKLALWGGTRLAQEFSKETGNAQDVAESWEVSDLPGNVSFVSSGPFAGWTLRKLMEEYPVDLLGRHAPQDRFPVMVKFLDAQQRLSVQVHPKDPTLMSDGVWRTGKAEFWVVVAADPSSQMHLGLRAGVSEQQFRRALTSGDFEDCLYAYRAQPGDCIYLEPGTVHSLGGGLLIAEIQQPSDVTYRLYDWERLDATGQLRQLHVEAGMAATSFDRGPVLPMTPRQWPGHPHSEELVTSPHFVVHRHWGPAGLTLANDNAMHVFVMLNGRARQGEFQINRGQTIVIPAARKEFHWDLSADAIVLDAHLPL